MDWCWTRVICCILWRICIRAEDVFPMPESMTCPFITLRFNRGEEGSSISKRRRIHRGNFYKVSYSNSPPLPRSSPFSLKINAFWTNLQGICTSHLSSAPSIKDTDTSAVKLNSDLAWPHFSSEADKKEKERKRHNGGRDIAREWEAGARREKQSYLSFFLSSARVLLRMRLSP